MLILPNQAGIALGMFVFAAASLVSIFSGVTLEIAILRAGVAFLIFSVFGWLMAYLIYEEEKPESEKKKPSYDDDKVEEKTASTPTEPAAAAAASAATPVAAPASGDSAAGSLDDQGLEAPDDSDF
ncbi:MAG TPA: hypothetical protein QF468_07990 [Nitrospinota bacterium]|jgi:predicted lipid-binding transport protein (Tim44 family)|nr:hypothetical protein [Nitrospinota bacterium]